MEEQPEILGTVANDQEAIALAKQMMAEGKNGIIIIDPNLNRKTSMGLTAIVDENPNLIKGIFDEIPKILNEPIPIKPLELPAITARVVKPTSPPEWYYKHHKKGKRRGK